MNTPAPDFHRVASLGAIELQLRLLEAGGVPPSTQPADMSAREAARRIAFCAEIGERLLDSRLAQPEVKP